MREPKVLKRWLIVRANGDIRVTKTRPPLQWNEVAFNLTVKVASSWASTVGDIALEIPEGTIVVEQEGMEQPEATS